MFYECPVHLLQIMQIRHPSSTVQTVPAAGSVRRRPRLVDTIPNINIHESESEFEFEFVYWAPSFDPLDHLGELNFYTSRRFYIWFSLLNRNEVPSLPNTPMYTKHSTITTVKLYSQSSNRTGEVLPFLSCDSCGLYHHQLVPAMSFYLISLAVVPTLVQPQGFWLVSYCIPLFGVDLASASFMAMGVVKVAISA